MASSTTRSRQGARRRSTANATHTSSRPASSPRPSRYISGRGSGDSWTPSGRSSETRRNVMEKRFLTRRNVMTVFHTSKKCVETCFRMCLKTCQIPACAMLKNVYVVLDFPASIPRSTSSAESLEVASMSRSYSTPRMSWRRTAYCICRCIWRRCCRIREETAMKPWSVGKCSGWQSFLSGFL